MRRLAVLSICSVLLAGAAQAAPASPPPAPVAAPGKVVIEIYRIAPGQQKAFLELINRYDEANREAGLPARQLYVHQDGGSWDFVIIQPAETPPGKEAALAAASKRLGVPSGNDGFFAIRSFIAEHSDTFALGPTSARDFLARKPD
jgi:hypothetical protein